MRSSGNKLCTFPVSSREQHKWKKQQKKSKKKKEKGEKRGRKRDKIWE